MHDALIDQDRLHAERDAYGAFLQHQRWRCVWVISGEAQWTRTEALAQQRARQWSSVWVSDTVPDCVASRGDEHVHHVSAKQLPTLLGTETNCVVLDVHDSLDANILCMSCGYVTAGGALIILMPTLTATHCLDNRPHHSSMQLLDYPQDITQLRSVFAHRLLAALNESEHVIWQSQNQTMQIPSHRLDSSCAHPPNTHILQEQIQTFIEHPEQRSVVEAIKRCAQGHAKRPVVIYANRGRGKSTALGMAAYELLLAGKRRIVVCAQHAQHVSAVFQAIATVSEQPNNAREFTREGGRIQFASVDDVLASDEVIDCLMIDEAATLSVDQLKQLSVRCNRVVYATTVFGYEGTGQGFKHRLLPYLRTQFPQLKEVTIQQPIRWSAGDGLDEFIMRACFMESELVLIDELESSVVCERLDHHPALQCEPLLKQVYALMLNAHYRTSPRDLQQLLDDQRMRCYALLSAPSSDNGVLLALALVKEEGGLDESIAQAIVHGTRRVKGHLLTQHVLQESGNAALGPLMGARITRIVTHPSMQRRSLGRDLLAEVRTQLIADGFDYWGTSFGARESLLPFWQCVGMRPFFLGHKKNNRSGEYNCLYIESLTEHSAQWVEYMTQRFQRSLPSLAILNPHYRVSLLRQLLLSVSSTQLSAQLSRNARLSDAEQGVFEHLNDRLDVRSQVARYIEHRVAYERVFHELRQFATVCLHNMTHWPQLNPSDWDMLIHLFYVNEPVKTVTKRLLFERKKHCEAELKRVLLMLLNDPV
ncbi:MAG: GNAT family N-acetyltransferase [Pseudomonadota bacterium]